jgi:hypothetical protein
VDQLLDVVKEIAFFESGVTLCFSECAVEMGVIQRQERIERCRPRVLRGLTVGEKGS